VSTTLVLLETWSIHFLFYLTVGTQADVCKAYGVIHAATAFLRVWEWTIALMVFSLCHDA